MYPVRYGPEPSQEGDLHLPGSMRPPVIVLLHGGFWRLPYGREPLRPLALDLVRRGFAVWNLGYRRVGEEGGGWPGTLEDVAMGLDALVDLEASGIHLDLAHITVVGHSAGGQLALASACDGFPGPQRVWIHAAVGLAPLSDLHEAHALGLGGGAVEAFLGGTPASVPDRYALASPAARLPLGVRQLLIHGSDDNAVPMSMSRAYVTKAQAAGDDVALLELKGGSHMDFLDPAGVPHAALCRWLEG